MKKYLMFVISTLIVCAAVMARADSDVQSEVVDGVTWYYGTSQQWNSQTQQYETCAYITSGADKYTGDLTVPSVLCGYAVKKIGSSAFKGCSALTSVTIPEGVTSIGSHAFYNCSALTSATIPEGVTSIGSYAFSSCSALTSVTIPEGVTSIGSDAFSSCSALTSVTIPEGVTSIGSDTFYNCSALTSVTLPEGVTSIGSYAFYNCSALERFDVPASVTSLGDSVIRGCDSLRTITVAKGNANYKCINNCIVSASGTTLIAVPFGCEEVAIPEGVTEIPGYAFYDNLILESVVIPSTVKIIGERAFYNCDSLIDVEIPEGVTDIGYAAFCGCASLETVVLPSSLNTVGTAIFSGCNILTSVLIPYGVKAIGDSMFAYCRALVSVEIPASVTSIGVSAFTDCYALKNVTIPASVASVGKCAFYCCNALKEVTLLGAPPSGIENSYLLSYASNVSYPREYGGAWMKVINDVGKFRGYNRKQPDVTVLSSRIRVNDPTILDVVYKVTSAVTNTVKVRALAFEDGERSFAKVVRPETFVVDTNGVETAGNVGDHVAANVEHTLSWKVSADWSNQLAKVSFEVLASEVDLLPLEVRTIPASDQYGKMDVTWNAITESQWFDALLWLYADKNDKVTISDGVYYYDGKVAAKDTAIYSGKTESDYYSRTRDPDTKQYVYVRYKNAPEAVLEEMGYTVLSGEVLNYVNEETRLGLSPSGTRQYGYKIVSEK